MDGETMSGERTPAEVVKDLRGFIDWYGCDPGVPMSAVDVAAEAAALIERLTGENERLIVASFAVDEGTVITENRLAAFEAALPACPTCGGSGRRAGGLAMQLMNPLPCPDCVGTGKVSPAQLAVLWQAVHGLRLSTDGNWVHSDEGMFFAASVLLNYLRAVRP